MLNKLIKFEGSAMRAGVWWSGWRFAMIFQNDFKAQSCRLVRAILFEIRLRLSLEFVCTNWALNAGDSFQPVSNALCIEQVKRENI